MCFTDVNIPYQLVFTSLSFGSMMPYALAALTMKSVGEALKAKI